MNSLSLIFKLVLCLSVFFINCNTHAGDGNGTGNGGDVVHCKKTSENDFEGVYALDYLLTFIDFNKNEDIVAVKSWEESKERIFNSLQKLDGAMAANFTDFSNHLDNRTDESKERIWIPASFGVVDLNDEELTRKIPLNCRLENGEPNLTQLVRRSVRNKQISYEYDTQNLDLLKRSRPLQYSMAVVHEFLWDITDEVDVVRRLNRLLHSTLLDTYTKENFQLVKQNFGVSNIKSNDEKPSQENMNHRLFGEARLGNFEMVRYWHQLGASVNFSSLSETVLMAAAAGKSKGHFQSVKYLLANGAFVDLKNHWGRTALSFACSSGRADSVQVLLDAGADKDNVSKHNETPLIEAAQVGNLDAVQILIKEKADISFKGPYRRTAMMIAAGGRNWAVAEELLKAGSEAGETDADGLTTLHYAVQGSESLTKALLAAGAPVDPKSSQGYTPLFIAVFGEYANEEAIQALINAKAEVDVNVGGKTPLIVVAQSQTLKNKYKVLEILLKAGANPNLLYDSPLYEEIALIHFFADKNDVKGLKILLDHGTEVNLPAKYGRTALSFVATNEMLYEETIKLLLERNANPYLRLGPAESACMVWYNNRSQEGGQLQSYCEGTVVGEGRVSIQRWQTSCSLDQQKKSSALAKLDAERQLKDRGITPKTHPRTEYFIESQGRQKYCLAKYTQSGVRSR